MRAIAGRRLSAVLLLVLAAVAVSGCATLRSTGAGGSGSVWLWDNPRMAGNELRAVAFADGQEGWAVGRHGTILHTTDAGSATLVGTPPFTADGVINTRTEFSGTDLDLNGVAIALPERGTVWAVGEEGLILRTVNSGQTWLPVPSSTGYRLNAVDAQGLSAAWTVGERGTIRRWNGSLWTWQSSGTTAELLSVDFVSATTGYIGGRGRTLLKTLNGGATWTSAAGNLPPSADITSLSFASAGTGFATTWNGAEGALWRTDDGAATWTKMYSEAGTSLDSVTASGTAEVWATGANGFAFHTDGSSTTTATLCDQELRGTCAAGGKAWAVGERGRVFVWAGGWAEKSSLVTVEDLRAYSAISQWAVGENGTVVKWTPSPFSNEPTLESLDTTSDLTALAFTDSSRGWVTAEDGTVFRIVGYALSGTSRVAVSPTSIATTNAVDVWLTGNLGANGYVLHSADAGSSWTTATTYPNVHLFGISARGECVYAVGGVTSGTSDAVATVFDGSGWTRRDSLELTRLRAVYAISAGTAVAVGDAGLILRTVNGGATWQYVSPPGANGHENLNAVSFGGESDGRAVGDDGAVFTTADGGATWTKQDAGTHDDLLGVDVSEGVQRVVGARGAVLVEVWVNTEGLAGTSRYDTAIEVSRNTWEAGEATTVVLATGENWPDAVSGSSLAGAVDGPMLLTRRTSVPGGLVAEMKRLGAQKAYVLGSTRVVDQTVVDAIEAQMGAGFTTQRIAGADRYETCARIASATVDEIVARGGTYDHSAFLTTGLNWPDALAVAPIASHAKEPVLLTRPTGLPAPIASAIAGLDVTSGVVLGSVSAVPASVTAEFASVVGTTPARWSGPSRYDTAAQIAEHGIAERGLEYETVAFATGYDFPDALSGGVAQGHLNGPLLLTPPNVLAPAAGTFLWSHRPAQLRFVGGVNVLPLRPRNEAVWVLTSGF